MINNKEYRKYFYKHGHPPPRKCKNCGVDVDKNKHYCIDCHEGFSRGSRKRKYTICGFEGCKEQRTYRKHSCEYHSRENRDKRYMEEIVICHDCGVDIGKRKEHKSQRHCNDCSEIRRERGKKKRIKFSQKWFKEKYHNDEDFRQRYLEYQRQYNKKRTGDN